MRPSCVTAAGRRRTLGGFSRTSQHRLKVVLIYGTFGAPFAENGTSGLVEKLPLYVQLMKQGYSNSEACRVLGVHRNTGNRWLHGRNGVEGLHQQGLDPRPRIVVPAVDGSSRYLSEDERVFIADRLLAGSSLRSIAGILDAPHLLSAGSWRVTVLTPAAIISSVPRNWHREGA